MLGKLYAKGIPAENIRKYGFAFEGKKVLIGCAWDILRKARNDAAHNASDEGEKAFEKDTNIMISLD